MEFGIWANFLHAGFPLDSGFSCPCLVPVWISFPSRTIHYFDKHSLFSILNPVGRPLFLDSAAAVCTRPSVARVCVEVDLLKPICKRIWVAVEGEADLAKCGRGRPAEILLNLLEIGHFI